MAYTDRNFRTKKAMKEAVASGQTVTVFQPGPYGGPVNAGRTSIEGPHFPEPHKWYARVLVENGQIVKVIC